MEEVKVNLSNISIVKVLKMSDAIIFVYLDKLRLVSNIDSF